MTYSTAKKLLSVDIDLLSLEELQKYKVKIIDALREANAEYGYSQAYKKRFFYSDCVRISKRIYPKR